MDIGIAWSPTEMRGDWQINAGDLQVGSDLETAVLVSLFTDRIADPDYVAPAGSPQERRGWWGDTYEVATGGSPIGSRLWTLNRAVRTDTRTLPARARDICREALQWLLDSGVVASVTVTTGWVAGTSNALAITIGIVEPSGSQTSFDYQWAWNGIS